MSKNLEKELILRADSVCKDYTESSIVTHVLKGVDLDIYSDEMVAIIGSSGSGKSTLLHILGTLDKPTKGAVYYQGENLFKLGNARCDYFRNHILGFVYQFHHLLSDFTAYENVAFPMMISGDYNKKQIDERVKYLLDRVGLGHRLNHRERARPEVQGRARRGQGRNRHRRRIRPQAGLHRLYRQKHVRRSRHRRTLLLTARTDVLRCHPRG